MQQRPWKTDAELEQESTMRGGYGYGGGYVTMRPERPPQPWATYALLLTFLVYFVIELVVFFLVGPRLFYEIFTIQSINPDGSVNRLAWITRPWSPITATLSHSPVYVAHLLFNGLGLYFFGPYLEHLLGRNRFLALFFVSGAVSSIVQAVIAPGVALGASGALLALIGVTIILRPHAKIFLFPFPVPIPLWVAGIIFALVDITGAMSGARGIGNFAHLSGMALGLLYGLLLKRPARPKGSLLAP